MTQTQQSAGNTFAASLLERSAAGYAGLAASLMQDGEARPGGEAAWRSHLTQRVLELAAAVVTGDAGLFLGRITWSRKLFTARGQDDRDLRSSLKALREVLAEHLPEAARGLPLTYLDQALALLATAAPAPDASALDPDRPLDRLALQYIQKILEGDVPGAISTVTAAVASGLNPQAAYTGVLLPAQREVGRLWHSGDISVAEEHMVSAATHRAMAVLANQAPVAAPNGQTVVVAAVAGNVHDLGLRALADLYQLAGWRVVFLGADVPMHDLPGMLAAFEAELLMLGATLATHVPKVEQAIRSIRERSERPVHIMVGGAAFDETPGLWQKVGSDGYAATINEALAAGAKLVR